MTVIQNSHNRWAATVRESCGRAWKNELLSFPLAWAPGEQPDDGVALALPAGPICTQISDKEWHPDGTMARANAFCRLSLQAGETVDLRLTDDAGPAVSSGLHFNQVGNNGYVAGNDHFAVMLSPDGAYPAGLAPGPIMAIQIEGGEWLGEGLLLSTHTVKLSTELLDEGPLFLRWRTTVSGEQRRLAFFECTLYDGEDFIRIKQSSSRDAEMIFQMECFPGLEPDCLLTKGGGEHILQTVRHLDYGRPEEIATIDFHSGHHQMSLTWAGVYREGGEEFLGAVELNGSSWTNTSMNRLHFYVDPPGSLTLEAPVQGGVMEWALVCSTTAINVKAAGSRECNHLSDIHTRWSAVPLQKVKDWVLDWEPDTEPRPFLQSDSASIEQARAKVKANPDWLAAYRRWTDINTTASRAASRAALWIALGDEKYAQEAVVELEKEIRVTIDRFWAEGAYMRLIIFDGRIMKMWLQAYDVLMGGGFISADVDGGLRRDLAFVAYCMEDPEFFPKHLNFADHNDPDSYFHGLGQTIGDAMCPPNFHTEYFTTYGMMGCCFRSHPHAAAWRKDAAELLDRQLEVHFYDSGGYVESPNYHSHSLMMTTQLALCLRQCGDTDFFEHPRFKAQYDHFCQMQTPPILLSPDARKIIKPWAFMDPDLERLAMLPGNGNTGSNCSDQYLPAELAMAGAIYRESDPILSERCMTTWRRAGRPIANTYNDLSFLFITEPQLPGAAQVGLDSTLLEGSFVTFRGSPETPDEVFVLTKNGTATHHNDFDEGGFTIWAYGAPVASDFGYHVNYEGAHYTTGDTWKHNCVEFDGKSSGYGGMEITSPPEDWISTDLADLLVSYIPINNFRDLDNMFYTVQVPAEPIEYRRYTLFVKPHYMIVLDSILKCAYSHKWWLHSQATGVEVNGPRARFKGAFGVDLIAHFITPEAPNIKTGEFTLMKHICATQGLARDWRVFVAPAKPGQDFEVTSESSGRVIRVATPEYDDTIFLSHFPFEYRGPDVSFEGRAGVHRRYRNGQEESAWLDGEGE